MIIYFVFLLLIGSFFVVNLVVAVIYQAYVSEGTDETEEWMEGRQIEQARHRGADARAIGGYFGVVKRGHS